MWIAPSELRSQGSEPSELPRRTPRTSSSLASAEVFEHLLVHERRRSERSNRSFLLLSLRAPWSLDPGSSRMGKAVVEALVASMRGTDILGWIASPHTIGIICPEIGAAQPQDAVEALRARLYSELARRVDDRILAALSLDFRIFPESSEQPGSSQGQGRIDPVFHPDIVQAQRKHRVFEWVKRMLDVVVSLSLLIVLAPVLLLVALAVYSTSPGPVLFGQVRLGKMGRPFKMLKFRSMYVNAGEREHYEFVTRFIKESGRQSGANGQIYKLTNDPRVTPVGRFIRKTSLDELPQLWNVVVGQMSLVGPRPPLPYEIEQYAPWHRRRILEAKPGITGLWQVTARSRTTFDEMVRLDLQYARERSLWTDLKILLRTPGAVVSGKGAA